MKPALFEAVNLEVRAGSFKLRDISFSLDTDHYLVILGPTGCGKTILLETLAGLRTPTKGRIYLRGKDITLMPPESRHFGFAYQDSLLYPFLNVKENILFGAKARQMNKDPKILKRADSLAEIMGISHLLNRYPKFLSGGEKQRVSLARAILTRPPLLLLDEPLSSLDPKTRCLMQELLREVHQKEELGIIHVTHDFNEALQLASHLIIMNNGEILQQGKPLDVFFQPSSLYIANFLMGENLLRGSIEWRDNRAWFKHSENELVLGPLDDKKLPAKLTGEVTLLIRAGDLILSRRNECGLNPRNSWDAFIEQINLYSTHIEVICAGHGTWKLMLSRAEGKRMKLQKRDTIRLSVDNDDIHVILK